MLKKAVSNSSRASSKSSSSPPKFVKNEILATSLIHICIGVCPLLSFCRAWVLLSAFCLAREMIVLTSFGLSKAVLLVSLFWIWCPDTFMNVSSSITGCRLLVMTPNAVTPATISSRKEIPKINITLFLFGVSEHCMLADFFDSGSTCGDCILTH